MLISGKGSSPTCHSQTNLSTGFLALHGIAIATPASCQKLHGNSLRRISFDILTALVLSYPANRSSDDCDRFRVRQQGRRT